MNGNSAEMGARALVAVSPPAGGRTLKPKLLTDIITVSPMPSYILRLLIVSQRWIKFWIKGVRESAWRFNTTQQMSVIHVTSLYPQMNTGGKKESVFTESLEAFRIAAFNKMQRLIKKDKCKIYSRAISKVPYRSLFFRSLSFIPHSSRA